MTTSPPAELLGAQRPRLLSLPPRVSSAGEEAVELAASAGLHLDPWQSLVLEGALGERADGQWAAFEVGLVVARQNGKGAILEARELAGLFLLEEELILHSSHEFKTSIEGFRRIRSVVENNAAMAKRVAHIRTSHGDESIELKPTKAVITGANGRQVTRSRSPRLRFVARTSGSGRGFSGDVVILDEAFNLPDAVMSALMPTMSARPNPQLWYTSSAVNQDEHPNGVVLARLRDRGLKGDDPSLAYYEWSADDEAYRSDPLGVALDPAQWAAANPGLGIRISEEHIGREQRSMGSKSFQVERLTIGDWPSTDEELTRVIPGDVWNALKDDASTVQDPVVFAADANPERSAAAIAVVGARPDGLVHGEVIDARDGVTWAPARLVELNKQWRPKAIVLDPSGPAGAWLPALEKAGMQTKSESNPDGVLVLITGREMAQACGGFYTAVTEDSEFRHIGQTPLDDALGGAKTRPLGDAWAWARRHSDINIAPLVAVTLAHYGHALYGHTAPPGAPNIW